MKIQFTTTDLGEARLLANAASYKLALQDIENYLRSGIKHEGKPWDAVRAYLYEVLREYNLTLEDDYEPTEESCSGGCACGRAAPTDGDGGNGEDGDPTGPLVRLGR